MSSDTQSNIRVLVHWRDQTVFAGEELRCTITFKNVAQDPRHRQQSSQQPTSQPERQKLLAGLTSPLHSRNRGTGSLSMPPPTNSGRGHRRSALSLSIPNTTSHSRSATVQWPQSGPAGSDGRPGHAHKRSLSIVSIGSASTMDDPNQRSDRPPIPHRGHSRASSLQIFSKVQQTATAGPQSGIYSPRHTSSPLYNSSYPPDRFGRLSAGSTASSTPHTPVTPGRRRSPRNSPNTMPEFRFPAAAAQEDEASKKDGGLLSPRLHPGDANTLSQKQKELGPSPAARILSSTGIAGGTPRSSGEFYSISNHSSETLASEYPSQPAVRSNGRPPHLRRSSGLSSQLAKSPESLMMGYAQVQGSFLLDGSLVSLGPFEQVKKKAVVGGRGGGVIGLESGKKESSLLRNFGWGSISNSIGDLLGGNELSSIKEMRGAANSKSVPLLTTPQSILFVDLQLAPGDSRSYEYTFRLPRGLPPSHKGKTIKIVYTLVIGTQRAGGAKEQQVKYVEIPFRVLGGVNSQGEILGHDLMNPYIILRDEAKVTPIGKGSKSSKKRNESENPQAINEFLSYVDELVAQQQEQRSGTLLSPTDSVGKRRPSTFEESASTAKEAIHLAIMKSNMANEGQSQNRFEIARNGQRVGAVMLPRPAYRLGEVVTMVIDFANAQIPCLAVHATLETAEKIDPAFAIRSESSIQRVTRKVYAASSEVTMYSRRVVFTPTIPITATPEFVTSGVSFEWKIRVEFVVPSQPAEEVVSAQEGNIPYPLLEQISQDEKGGLVLVAAENLACESFDVSVPIRVYGAVGTGLERLERDEASEEGLAV